MQYIQMTNDTLVVSTSKGSHQLNTRSFNYNKLKKLLESGADEEEVLPLLEPVELPEGIYEAYLIPSSNDLYYIHMEDSETQGCISKTVWVTGRPMDSKTLDKRLLGVYASLLDLKMDWPEYFF